MRTLQRYIGREVALSTLLIFVALLMLFAFFDLIHELRDVGKGGYQLRQAVLFVVLALPGHLYELFPVAALIGTLFAMSQLVANSEYTIMRASGMSLTQITWALVRVGIPIVIATFLAGEYLAPPAERLARAVRVPISDQPTRIVAQQFRSGFWFKQDQTFVNIRGVLEDLSLLNIIIYEFDEQKRLKTIKVAETGNFLGNGRWKLTNMTTTEFLPRSTKVSRVQETNWDTVLKPSLLSVYQVAPEKLELDTLYDNIRVLGANKQRTSRFEIALWTKIFYPVAVLVMMLLALPFSYFQRRSGGIGFRIFAGTMLGLTFFLLNQLFSHLGIINNWPPLFSAAFPIAAFLIAAAALLWRLERR